jgi:hypothetical protein
MKNFYVCFVCDIEISQTMMFHVVKKLLMSMGAMTWFENG